MRFGCHSRGIVTAISDGTNVLALSCGDRGVSPDLYRSILLILEVHSTDLSCTLRYTWTRCGYSGSIAVRKSRDLAWWTRASVRETNHSSSGRWALFAWRRP